MFRVKIYGAGSIGNHLANASRRLGWAVTVCDVNSAALARMRDEIYPSRYGAWDPAIELSSVAEAPRGGFDIIHIGTPPDSHIPLAIDALTEAPRALLIEKPLSPPDLARADELSALATSGPTRVLVGYDHVVGKAMQELERLLSSGVIGPVKTIDVEFREHWGGIFAAHPWLSGPADSYLGFWRRGGGASGEHSHAVNLWQHLAHVVGAGRVAEVAAMLNYVHDGQAHYDDLCLLSLRTEGGLSGRVVQDVVTRPHRKRARIQGAEAALEWVNGYNARGDAVIVLRPGQPDEVIPVEKTRPDDFIWELQHIERLLKGEGPALSPLDLSRGLDTMLVVAAAHQSEASGQRVRLDYARGDVPQANL
ncbi:MAG: Gfo/Idh/MocA family oxidoreductase [Oscillochloris sp.]|nr:Gfo/Idh/MocA family oxidoreductase [Oscillochloris sp.]